MAIKTTGSFAESTQGAYKIKTTPSFNASALAVTRSDAIVTPTETTDLAGKSLTVTVGVTGAGDKGTSAVAATNTFTFHNDVYTQATATVTMTGIATADEVITIVSADGTSKAYTAKAAQDASANQFQVNATPATQAENLKLCIEHSSGHNGKITVVRADGVLTLTQAASTGVAPSVGNKAITENLSNATKTDFTGGATTATSSASIKLIDGVGDEVTYTPVVSGASAFLNQFNLGGAREDAAANFVGLVNNSSKGHGDSEGITGAHSGSGVVLLTQKVAGVAGNTTTTMAGNMPAYTSVDLSTKFSGGVDRIPVKTVLQVSSDGVNFSSEDDSVVLIADTDTGATGTRVGTITAADMPSAPYYRIGINVDQAANLMGAANGLINTIAFSYSTV